MDRSLLSQDIDVPVLHFLDEDHTASVRHSEVATIVRHSDSTEGGEYTREGTLSDEGGQQYVHLDTT